MNCVEEPFTPMGMPFPSPIMSPLFFPFPTPRVLPPPCPPPPGWCTLPPPLWPSLFPSACVSQATTPCTQLSSAPSLTCQLHSQATRRSRSGGQAGRHSGRMMIHFLVCACHDRVRVCVPSLIHILSTVFPHGIILFFVYLSNRKAVLNEQCLRRLTHVLVWFSLSTFHFIPCLPDDP